MNRLSSLLHLSQRQITAALSPGSQSQVSPTPRLQDPDPEPESDQDHEGTICCNFVKFIKLYFVEGDLCWYGVGLFTWLQQKVVIKVAMNGQKSRSKAMKIAVVSGVESVAFKGKEMDEVEVIGDGIDAAVLTSLLRKNVGHAELLSVGSAEKKEEKKNEIVYAWNSYPYESVVSHYPIYPVYNRADSCSIM